MSTIGGIAYLHLACGEILGETGDMDAATGLVGRETELSQLSKVFSDNAGRAVLVSGQAGIGKTALLEQACAQAVADGWLDVRVLGVEAEESFALGGLNQLVFGLRGALASLDEPDRAALEPVAGGELDSSLSAMQLMTAVLHLLVAASELRPVLLLVDDVQWLDDVSAVVLGAVGRRLVDQKVRILAGRRVPSESKFTTEGWTEIFLDPLEAGDSEQLLARATVPLTPSARQAILAESAGNPLALVELPRAAAQVEGWVGNVPLTERLVTVFGGRLKALTPSVRAELLRAALDGRPFSAPLANQGRYVMSDVHEAVKAGLLNVNPLGQAVFRHPLVSAAVIHQASEQDRRGAHRELAELYKDVPVRRAVHLAASATGPDQEVADLLAQAAQLSVRQGGLGAAIEWLHRAAELSTDPGRRSALRADAVFFAARAGRFDKARDISDSTHGDEENSVAAALAIAYGAFHGRGEVSATHRQLIHALERGDTLDDETLNQLVQLLLTITNFGGDYERWRETNDALEPLSSRVDPAILLFRHRYSDVTTTAGAVRALLDERIPRLASLGPREVNQLAFPAYSIDALADLRDRLALSYRMFRAEGASIDAMAMGCAVMLDLMARGQWAAAERVGADCLDMAHQIEGGELLRHHFLANLGILAAWQGDFEAARRYATTVTAWSQSRGLGMYLDFARRITVLVALAEADFETAYQAAVSICPPERFPPFSNQVGDGLLDLVEAAIHTGRLAEAQAHVAEVARLKIAEVSPRVEALTTAVSAMTAPDSEAGELYESALCHTGLAEFPFEHARITLAHGMWLRRQRRFTEARTALTKAAKEFEYLGAHPWAERAHSEFRAAGAPGNRAVDRNAPLSPQERRIAELAATGATTKQIAIQLTISPRTVDTHMRNLFAKLGVTSRAALGTALRQLDSVSQTKVGD